MEWRDRKRVLRSYMKRSGGGNGQVGGEAGGTGFIFCLRPQ